ncbi:MAG: SDR family oxidoreductase [Alphaproteobacteria bacterium]|nr:SDR family oxidoreductase [Alphaproteobacteria bacterium]
MAGVLARAGAQVVAVARRKDRLESLEEKGRIAAHQVDLASVDEYDDLASELSAAFGDPDILVNAAGVNFREPSEEISAESWDATLHLNLSVPFFLARALVPAMVKKGRGNIINIASLQSYRAFDNGVAYGASKGGVTQLTRAMAQAWSKDGVAANAIAPGFFPTELTQAVFGDDALSQRHAAATAVGRNGALADLDGTTVFLASGGASYLTGQVVAVDGGYLAT